MADRELVHQMLRTFHDVQRREGLFDAMAAALAVAEKAFAQRDVLAVFRSLPTDQAREELLGDIFEEFCRHCGTKQPLRGICQCWNDE
jgi:hypothetical protein